MGPPASAIALFILERGGASSSEILLYLQISQQTLRRRRPALARLGIEFVENGSGSYYVPRSWARPTTTCQLPSTMEQSAQSAHPKERAAEPTGTSGTPKKEPEPYEADLSGYEQPDPEKVARWLERGYGAVVREPPD